MTEWKENPIENVHELSGKRIKTSLPSPHARKVFMSQPPHLSDIEVFPRGWSSEGGLGVNALCLLSGL
jgi:hypothetical protein